MPFLSTSPQRALALPLTVALLVAAAACIQPATSPPPAAGSAPSAGPLAAASGPAATAAPTTAPTSAAATGAATPVVLSLFGGAADAGAYIAYDRGYFQEAGLDIQFKENLNGTSMIPFLATGELDVGGAAAGASFYNALNRGAVVKIVADKGHLAKGFGYEGLVVRADLAGTIRSFGDLKGRQVALSSKPNIDAVLLSEGLQRAGLGFGDLADVLEMPNPEMVSALGNRSVDAAVLIEPFITRAEAENIGSTLARFDEVSPNHQVGVLFFSPQFITGKTDAARRFMVAYLRGVREYDDAFVKNQNRPAIVQLLTKYTSVKDPAIWDQMVPPGLNPDGYVDLPSLAADAQYYLDQGYLQSKVDVNQVVDNSLVEYAVQQLGPYAR